MTTVLVVSGLTSVLALSALAFSCFALFHTRALAATGGRRAEAAWSASGSRIEELRHTLEVLASEVRDLRVQPGSSENAVKSGLNLSRRSQALRMHRRGEPAGAIASALNIPAQEVELLIKVHQIVLSTLTETAPPS